MHDIILHGEASAFSWRNEKRTATLNTVWKKHLPSLPPLPGSPADRSFQDHPVHKTHNSFSQVFPNVHVSSLQVCISRHLRPRVAPIARTAFRSHTFAPDVTAHPVSHYVLQRRKQQTENNENLNSNTQQVALTASESSDHRWPNLCEHAFRSGVLILAGVEGEVSGLRDAAHWDHSEANRGLSELFWWRSCSLTYFSVAPSSSLTCDAGNVTTVGCTYCSCHFSADWQGRSRGS